MTGKAGGVLELWSNEAPHHSNSPSLHMNTFLLPLSLWISCTKYSAWDITLHHGNFPNYKRFVT